MLILSPSMGSLIFGKQIKISSDLLCPTILILPYPTLNCLMLLSKPAEPIRPLRPWSEQKSYYLWLKSHIFKVLVGPIIVKSILLEWSNQSCPPSTAPVFDSVQRCRVVSNTTSVRNIAFCLTSELCSNVLGIFLCFLCEKIACRC